MNSSVGFGLDGFGLQWVIETGSQTRDPLDTFVSNKHPEDGNQNLSPYQVNLVWGEPVPSIPILLPLSS